MITVVVLSRRRSIVRGLDDLYIIGKSSASKSLLRVASHQAWRKPEKSLNLWMGKINSVMLMQDCIWSWKQTYNISTAYLEQGNLRKCQHHFVFAALNGQMSASYGTCFPAICSNMNSTDPVFCDVFHDRSKQPSLELFENLMYDGEPASRHYASI